MFLLSCVVTAGIDQLILFRLCCKQKHSRNVCGVKHVRFEAYTAVVMEIQIFWDVTPCYALVIGEWHGIPEASDCFHRKIKDSVTLRTT
jgi:hypothetical protein